MKVCIYTTEHDCKKRLVTTVVLLQPVRQPTSRFMRSTTRRAMRARTRAWISTAAANNGGEQDDEGVKRL